MPLLTKVTRAGEWWEYKLVPIFAAFYATALMLDVRVAAVWPAALITLLALVPGAAYVSVINDLTDRADDLAAGKPNRLVGQSRAAIAAFVALPVACGLAISFWWRHDAVLLSFYLAAWLAFSLYSLPPFRFKARGILGVLCDASGAHLFPTLVAVVLAYRWAKAPLSPLHLAVIGAWALAHGLRGILWHQLTDVVHDRDAGVRTYAARHPRAAEILGTWVAFPVELLALAAMLALMRSAWPPAFLVLYALIVLLRLRWWRMHAVVVVPKPRFLIVLEEYYSVFFAVAILIATRDWIVLAVHLALFPVGPLRMLRDVWKLARERNHPS